MSSNSSTSSTAPGSVDGSGSKSLLSSQDFLELIAHNRLLPPNILTSFHSNPNAHDEDATEFANSLVDAGHLTRWQAKRLLSRRGGFTLGQYKLIDRIAAGGMGVVLKGWQPSHKRTVAIKILARTLLKKKDAVKRFEREIQVASALDHPNIVRTLDADCINNVPFLVMEYVEGKTLADMVEQRGQLPLVWSCELARQAALGLEHARSRNLVHRDIKPANLLLTRKSPEDPLTVKILDFGLARFTSESAESTELTGANQVFGTVDFIAPEQARSARSADIRADIFSLGCTLYHMLSGAYPFGGENVMEKLSARLAGKHTPLSKYRSDLPDEFLQVLDKMLAHKREDRFQTPLEVAQALEPLSSFERNTPPEGTSRIFSRSSIIPNLQPLEEEPPKESELALDQFLHQLETDPRQNEAGSELLSSRPQTFEWNRRQFVIVFLVAAALALFALILSGRGGRNQQEKQGEKSIADRNVPWPGTKEGMVFVWKAGEGGTFHVQNTSGARLNEDGVMELRGGAISIPELGTDLAAACQQTDEFCIELQFNTPDDGQEGPARILTFSSGTNVKERNVTLGQENGQLLIRLQTSERTPTDLMLVRKIRSGHFYHLLVAYKSGSLKCYLNGQLLQNYSKTTGDLQNWQPYHVVIGNEWGGQRPWIGNIERIAISNRFPEAQEVRTRYHLATK